MLRRLRVSLRQLGNQMARRPDLLCGAIVLGCLFVVTIKFTCSSRAKNVVAPARPPRRFFSPDPPVVDLFLGQLDQVDRLRSAAEISLIFFYAPWCAHSIAAREEVQQVARKLYKEVLFIAVNCWWNQGKCRKNQSFYQYPVIHLFYRRFGPIEYKGPFMAAYMEKFIRRVITPLTYLPSRAMLQDFLSYHEPGVVGYFEFNASPQPPGYIVFLTSALQALKRDFQGVVRFAVVTSKPVAEAIAVQEDGTVYMHRHFNTSLIFPRAERNFTSENICGWAYENRESVLQWLRPHGAKSRLLEQELSKGPALLAFLPFDPLAPHQPLVRQIAEVALQYHACNHSDGAEQDGMGQLQGTQNSVAPCCNTVVLPHWNAMARMHNVCELCLKESAGVWPSAIRTAHCPFHHMGAALESFHLMRRTFAHLMMHGAACSNVVASYSPFSRYSACCKTLGLPPPPPPRTRDSGVPSDGEPSLLGLMGLRCRTNKTLRFYLLDSHLHWKLAERLGAPRADGRRLFLTIVNLPEETHYISDLNSTLSDTLDHFIQNFSVPYSPLTRHLVGSPVPKSPSSLIREVTTASFLSTVMDPQKDVLLFYYTHWCGFCTVLNHVLIQLAQLFRGNEKFTVARVNVAQNDLPWEFMVDHFPVFLLFPRDRKHLSVKFPDDLPITLPNLVRFLLRHAGDVPRRGGWAGSDRGGLLEVELRRLREEVEALRRAREQLSQQLSQLWQEKRRLALHARDLESRNAELRERGRHLEELYREKNRQLLDAAGKLQALADASQNLITENALLKVLMASMREEVLLEPRGDDGAP
ncbi:thioredoxin domain-containing protein 11 isoform X1 [Paramormyrops kingsleyae]|uniref:thioredoxin domain-containing protein 11 isoform X1 n=1 Tax=Paramormyrops kingsleyae TaxID=1676925 RepID=UPI003B971D91